MKTVSMINSEWLAPQYSKHPDHAPGVAAVKSYSDALSIVKNQARLIRDWKEWKDPRSLSNVDAYGSLWIATEQIFVFKKVYVPGVRPHIQRQPAIANCWIPRGTEFVLVGKDSPSLWRADYKMRAGRLFCESIIMIETHRSVKEAMSNHDRHYWYKAGTMHTPSWGPLSTNIRERCGPGLHCFLDGVNAYRY